MSGACGKRDRRDLSDGCWCLKKVGDLFDERKSDLVLITYFIPVASG
jgi:hypothetical protein